MGTAVEAVIYSATPAGTDRGIGVYIDGEASLRGEGVDFVLVPPDVTGVIEGVLDPGFGPGWPAVVQDNGAHLDGDEGEDPPASVGDVGDPQAEADSASTGERVGILSLRRCRGCSYLACTGKVACVWYGRGRHGMGRCGSRPGGSPTRLGGGARIWPGRHCGRRRVRVRLAGWGGWMGCGAVAAGGSPG